MAIELCLNAPDWGSHAIIVLNRDSEYDEAISEVLGQPGNRWRKSNVVLKMKPDQLGGIRYLAYLFRDSSDAVAATLIVDKEECYVVDYSTD